VKRVSFGGFVLDAATRQLLRGADAVHVEPKALELLELLVDERPAAVSKRVIQERLWPDTFVSESSLTGLVAQLRRALGDDRHQERFIRTVHGFGYAFTAEVSSAPRGRVVWEDRTFPLHAGENVLGRGPEAAIRIDGAGVSRRHARIVVTEDGATIEDLGSKNGTFVDERRLDAPAALEDGCRFRLGRQLLVFRSAGPAAATATEGG
jgi:DNA-binding winged helix-turn-helix (wHTH) protein